MSPHHHRTPMLEDKRFIVTMFTLAAILGLSAAGRPPNEQVLTFLEILILGFIGQSQYGQTKRATAPAEPPKAP